MEERVEGGVREEEVVREKEGGREAKREGGQRREGGLWRVGRGRFRSSLPLHLLPLEILTVIWSRACRLLSRNIPLSSCWPLLLRGCVLVLATACLLTVRVSLLHGHLPHFSAQDNPASFAAHFQTRALSYAHLIYFNLRSPLNGNTYLLLPVTPSWPHAPPSNPLMASPPIYPYSQ